MALEFFQTILRKRKRYFRHAMSLLRYSSMYKIQNLVRVEWDRLRKKEIVSGLPYVMVLDPTNVCNLKCPICPTTRGELLQPSGRITLDNYTALIDRVADHTYRLILYNWGEPFLHRQIVEMLTHAHERKISTQISSNLNLLPREGAEALVLSGLDDLIVSCDGLSQETYERYRVGGELEKLISNMNAIRDAKKKLGRSNPNIEFQFLVFRHNEHEADAVHEFALSHGADTVRLVKPAIDTSSPDIKPAVNPEYVRPEYHDYKIPDPMPIKIKQAQSEQAEAVKILAKIPVAAKKPSEGKLLDPIDCYWPWRVLTLSWNGEIDPCCYNNDLGSFGNIFGQSIIDVLNNDKFRYARRRIVGKASDDGYDDVICKTCKGYTV